MVYDGLTSCRKGMEKLVCDPRPEFKATRCLQASDGEYNGHLTVADLLEGFR